MALALWPLAAPPSPVLLSRRTRRGPRDTFGRRWTERARQPPPFSSACYTYTRALRASVLYVRMYVYIATINLCLSRRGQPSHLTCPSIHPPLANQPAPAHVHTYVHTCMHVCRYVGGRLGAVSSTPQLCSARFRCLPPRLGGAGNLHPHPPPPPEQTNKQTKQTNNQPKQPNIACQIRSSRARSRAGPLRRGAVIKTHPVRGSFRGDSRKAGGWGEEGASRP